MANISIKIKNYDKIKKAFDLAPQRATVAFNKAIQQTVLLVESESKKLAPVNKQSGGGTLRQSISSLSNGLSGKVEVDAKYAVPVHEGTRPHIILPKNKKALANKRTGQFFGKRVNHPGTKAQPFLRDAVEQSTDKINDFFAKAVRDIIKL